MSGRYSIVPAHPQADRAELLAIATRNRPGPRARIELKFAKYYESNPLGPPSVFLARDNESEAFVGASALFPTILRVSGEPVPAAISADFAVDEGHRGFGPAVALQRATVAALSERGLKCAYGSPNESSEPIVDRTGYADVGRLTRFVKLLTARPVVNRYVRRPRLASLSVALTDPFVSIFSRDRLHRRAARFSVEAPNAFDDRFAGLWEATRRGQGVTSERTVELLNWKYEKAGPPAARGKYSIFALLDGAEVAGYAVYLVSDGVRLVYDLLCHPERDVIDALLAELILDAREAKAAAIDLGYVGPPSPLTRRLRAFGFLRRRAQNGLRVYLDGDSPHRVDLRRGESWYYMTGDTDF